MAWGTDEDVDRIVRAKLKPIRVKHKAEVQKLKDKIEILQTRLDRALNRESRLRFPDTTGQ
jgi:hypothetical protein